MKKLSVCIITLNEENKIESCLESLDFADEIVVVDSGSTDRTVELARKYTDKVYVNDFKDFSGQKNFAVGKSSGEWILSIDADEVVTKDLAREIKETIGFGAGPDGFYINRINHMYGKRLNHFSQPDYNIRLFRKNKGRFVQPVHEYVELEGKAGYLEHSFMHYSIADFAEHQRKRDLYTKLEVDVARQRHGLDPVRCFAELVLKPPLRFLQCYILLKGFKEGFTGLRISASASWVEFGRNMRCFKASLCRNEPNGKTNRSWSDVYSEPADIAKFNENISIHKEFLEEIVKTRPGKVLEVGCGSATLSVFLNKKGSTVTAIDKDEEIIARAKKASDNFGENINFRLADAFNLPFSDKEFDISFSQGVLEHFSDSDIKKLLKEQTRVAKRVFFSVPNRFYNHRDIGNERLLTKEQWEKVLSGFEIHTSKYYFEIRAKRNLLISRPVMYMAEVR